MRKNMRRKTRKQLKHEIRELKIKLRKLSSFDIQDIVMKNSNMDSKENTSNGNNDSIASQEHLNGVNDVRMQELMSTQN